MKRTTLHLLPNAHIDPVWLWDCREGALEAVSTCRCMVELMGRNPELTFIRGEAWAYEQVEAYAPELVPEIRRLIAAGRWDVVGGTYVQSDGNLPGTATYVRQLETGLRHFRERYGVEVRAGWSADCFGHSLGLVEIFAEAGIRYYAFNRPEAWFRPLPKPLFFWRGQGGGEVLCYRIPVGWYASERAQVCERLDEALEQSAGWDLENVAVFIGLGDHGGGPTQRHIDEIAAWRLAHPEVEVVYSTLHGFFQAAEAEIARRGRELVPVLGDELNFLMRGCYGSCLKTKSAYRDAEGGLKRASILDTAISVGMGVQPQDFSRQWRGLLFNCFHDILPGTSIERASVEQVDWLRGILSDARRMEFQACAALACRIDTQVPPPQASDLPAAVPALVFNPHPYPWSGALELEASLDSRPVWEYEGRVQEIPVELRNEAGTPLPFQRIDHEHNSFLSLPWRQRVLFETTLPPGGWRRFTLGYAPQAKAVAPSAGTAVGQGEILSNGRLAVEIDRAHDAIRILRDGTELFGGAGLALECCRDTWGSWGDQKERPEGYLCQETLERWRIGRVELLEGGPLRATLFAEFAGARSTATARISLRRDSLRVECAFRVVWNEAGTRLRIVTAPAEAVRYAVLGGELERQETGDVPGGRHLVWKGGGRQVGIATDHASCFGNYGDCFAVTLVRGSKYATDAEHPATDCPERPACDLGEHLCRISILAEASEAAEAADDLETPPLVLICDRHPGTLPSRGSLFRIDNPRVRLLDLQSTPQGVQATLQQFSAPMERARLWVGERSREATVPFARIVKVTM